MRNPATNETSCGEISHCIWDLVVKCRLKCYINLLSGYITIAINMTNCF